MPLSTDSQPGNTEASIRNGEGMVEIRRHLAGMRFPRSKREVVEALGDLEVRVEGDQTIPLADLLRGANVGEFTSADHVAEVARLSWSLPTEMSPPEGSG